MTGAAWARKTPWSRAPPDVLTAGYATTASFARGEDYEWVCATCYADFAAEFHGETDQQATT